MKQPLINREDRRSGNVALYLLGVVLLVAGFAGGRVLYRNGVSEVAVGGNKLVNGKLKKTIERDPSWPKDELLTEKGTLIGLHRDPQTETDLIPDAWHRARPNEWCTEWCKVALGLPGPAPYGNNKQCKNDDVPDTDKLIAKGIYQCNEQNCRCNSAFKNWKAGEGPNANMAVPVEPAEPEQPREENPPRGPDETLQTITALECPTYEQAMTDFRSGLKIVVVNGAGYYLCAFDYQNTMIGEVFKTINSMFATNTGGQNRKLLKVVAIGGTEQPTYKRWYQFRTLEEGNAEEYTIYQDMDGISTDHNWVTAKAHPFSLETHEYDEGARRTNLLFKAVFDKPYETVEPLQWDIAKSLKCNTFCEKYFGTKLEAPYARKGRRRLSCDSLRNGNQGPTPKYSGCTEAKCC